MKKRFLFASVAMAALLASCSNEEILNEQAVAGQEDRPTTNVALSFDEGNVAVGGVDSRSYFGTLPGQGYQWIFEDGDRIGGLLMDEWNGKACGIENFELKDYVHTNYAFIRETGADGKAKWVTPLNAPVCEGNYFFYFPYNNEMVHRGHVAWSINPVQKNYDENGNHWPMQAIKDNQKWIGYHFVGHEAEGKVNAINFDFVPLFAMPTFDIINKAADLKVNKLVVRVSSNRSNNQIDLNGTHDLMATTMVLAPESRHFENVNQEWEQHDFAWHQSQMWYHAQAYTDFKYGESYVHPVGDPNKTDMRWDASEKPVFPINAGDESYNMAPTYEYTALFENYKVKQMDHIQAMLVMPAGIYAYGDAQTFEAYIYVTSAAGDEYVVRIDLGKPQTQGDTNNSAYDDVNSAAANKFLKAGQITKFTADFDASALQSYNITDFKATSSSDLEWVIKEAIDSNKGDNGIYDLNLTTTGSRVELTPDIEKLLNERPNVRLHINGEITIGEGTSENAINLLWFDNKDMKTKLNIVNKQVKKVAAIVDPITGKVSDYTKLDHCSEINVGKDGELNTEAVTVEAGLISNEGIVKATDIIGDVENEGELTANKITGEVENEATLKANVISGSISNTASGDAVVNIVDVMDNNGTMSVGTVNDTWDNAGTLTFVGGSADEGTNEGQVTVAGATTFNAFENNGKMDINADVVLTGEATNNEVINVAADKSFKVRNAAELKNMKFAVINVEGNLAQNVKNSGEIFVKGDGQLIVDGIVDINGIIDVTEANGTVNDAQKAMDYKLGNEGNHFRYVIKESTDASTLKAALKARISSRNIESNFITVVFDADNTISYYGIMDKNILIYHVLVADGTTLTLEAAGSKTTEFQNLSNDCGTQIDYEAFEIEKGAKVIVADDATLKLNNGSEAWINGEFNANDHSTLAGKVEVKGNGTAWVSMKAAANAWSLSGADWTGEDWGWEQQVTATTASAALKANEKNIYVALDEDITLDIKHNDECIMGGEDTETITIDAKGKKITFNNLATENNVVKTANNAKLVIKNATLTNDVATTVNTWNAHDLAFACDVELINVVSEKAIALKADAKLNNVTINDANTVDTYAIWISALGQTVSLDNCTIDMLACSDGRGIKIDEQYVDAADVKKVTLKVSNTSFKTEEKAAIMVKSKAGADINLSNVDITGVAADTNNAVWVDEASEAYASLVKVNGGSMVVE